MLSLRVATLVALVLGSAPTGSLFAQEASALRPGDRVRVAAAECDLRKDEAIFRSLGDDLLAISVGDLDVQCPVGALDRLEVSEGKRTWWKAGLVGAGIVVVTGAVTASAVATPEGDNSLLALVWTGVLTPIGFLAGALARGERWREIPLSRPEFSMHLNPLGRVGFSLSMPFRR